MKAAVIRHNYIKFRRDILSECFSVLFKNVIMLIKTFIMHFRTSTFD